MFPRYTYNQKSATQHDESCTNGIRILQRVTIESHKLINKISHGPRSNILWYQCYQDNKIYKARVFPCKTRNLFMAVIAHRRPKK